MEKIEYLKSIIVSISTTEWIVFGFGISLFVLFMFFGRKIVNSIKKIMKSIIEGITSKRIVSVLGFLSFAFFVVLLLVMFSGSVANKVGCLLGTMSHENHKTETIRLIGWAISGVFVAIGLAVLSQRADAQMRAAEAHADAAKAQADAAKAQADAAKAQAGATQAQVDNNISVKKGRMQERFKTAAEHLGHDNASVRIAAFYEFVHLANENKEEYQKSILEILYAHIRTTTTNSVYSEEVPESGKPKPTEEIQGLLDVLFKFKEIDRGDTKPNLQRVCFSGVDLASGDLSGADLSKANLSGADLPRANLSEANLSEANLSRVDFFKTNLSGVKLHRANLFEADLSHADLSGANLSGANLSGADLMGADFSEADLSETNLSEVSLFGATLSETNLSRANLSNVHLSGVDLSNANLFGADLSNANLSGADLSKTRLFEVNLFEISLPNIQLGGAKYTNKTQFPEWIVPPIVPPDNGDEVQFPRYFIAPEKPKDDE